MKLSQFNFDLSKNLIAQRPVKPRDHSRLLVLKRGSGKIEHKYFYNLVDYLKSGDILVLNNSRVFPARLIGQRKETGGKIEVFLHKEKKGGGRWECLIGSGRKKAGLLVVFAGGLEGRLVADNFDGTWTVEFNKSGQEMMKIVNRIGLVPLPPYIKRLGGRQLASDKGSYQTIYADNKKIGSVAAPTAGLHFTKKLVKKLKKRGINIVYVTLHVGLGTFASLKQEDIKKHKMHSEWVEVKKGVIEKIVKAKRQKQRIVAVGTTSVRTLESIFLNYNYKLSSQENSGQKEGGKKGVKHDFKGWVNIFIYPGFKFKIVDAVITNFHLPKSTLFILASAFAGKKIIDKAYRSAIKMKYRFYSYGDAMLII